MSMTVRRLLCLLAILAMFAGTASHAQARVAVDSPAASQALASQDAGAFAHQHHHHHDHRDGSAGGAHQHADCELCAQCHGAIAAQRPAAGALAPATRAPAAARQYLPLLVDTLLRPPRTLA